LPPAGWLPRFFFSGPLSHHHHQHHSHVYPFIQSIILSHCRTKPFAFSEKRFSPPFYLPNLRPFVSPGPTSLFCFLFFNVQRFRIHRFEKRRCTLFFMFIDTCIHRSGHWLLFVWSMRIVGACGLGFRWDWMWVVLFQGCRGVGRCKNFVLVGGFLGFFDFVCMVKSRKLDPLRC